MAKEKYLYITFYTTAEAMATEEICKNNGLKGRLVPIPRLLSAGCGISWRGNIQDKDNIISLLEKEKIEYENLEII